MSDRNTNEKNTPAASREEIPASAAARIWRGLGGENEVPEPVEVEPVGFWENFWYHHKWKTIFCGILVFAVLLCTVQMCQKDDPDIYFMYAGPGYMKSREAKAVTDAIKQVMADYDGDGERGILLHDINYMTGEQIAEKLAQAEEEGVELYIDYTNNASNFELFEMEVIAGESVIYLLDPALYAHVAASGGLLPLEEVLGYVPEAAVDETGIRFARTPFARYFSAMDVFPEDSILCLRRVSTMAAFKGQKKTEKQHENHADLFCRIVNFTFPEGFVESTADETDTPA